MILNRQTMTSLEIAELTGMRHADVMRAIRNMESAWQKVSQRNFALSSYKQQQPNGGEKDVPCYVLDKTECLYVATKFNDEARAKLVLRWEELEKRQLVPRTFAEALRLAADQQEQIEAQARQIGEQQEAMRQKTQEVAALNGKVAEMEPKVSYYEKILASNETLTVTQIAQDYGMSAMAFNTALKEIGVQRKVNGQWILHTRHSKKGYVHSRSIDIVHRDGSHETKTCTEWTQNGRKFLYETLKGYGILPLTERG